ncbi:MAG: glucose-1-phosphate cytidylyltransferase [Gammaproteobacteria bacterium]|nr:glucose-1-phosphate cytidylyltransferase [Gammaproteobacteria bacterium]
MQDRATVPVFILCGGLGTRLKEETGSRPKPMVPIGDKPILWHLMRCYASFGFRKFVLCLGYKSEVVKSYFLNYHSLNSDFTVSLNSNDVEVHSVDHQQDWEVTLAFTGELNMTGSRIAQATQKYLGDSEHFAVTYGDGLTDADLGAEFEFHLAHERIGTVMGANPPSRFGELKLDGQDVLAFSEKPELTANWINAGFLFFRREFVNYLDSDPSCVLEQKPLTKLTDDNQLSIYKHAGFWQCMDTLRDLEYLDALWEAGNAPWVHAES